MGKLVNKRVNWILIFRCGADGFIHFSNVFNWLWEKLGDMDSINFNSTWSLAKGGESSHLPICFEHVYRELLKKMLIFKWYCAILHSTWTPSLFYHNYSLFFKTQTNTITSHVWTGEFCSHFVAQILNANKRCTHYITCKYIYRSSKTLPRAFIDSRRQHVNWTFSIHIPLSTNTIIFFSTQILNM